MSDFFRDTIALVKSVPNDVFTIREYKILLKKRG